MSGQHAGARAGQKRKDPPTSISTPDTKYNAKRVKTKQARNILAQASDKALNQNGDLDVSAFVKAREFEIRAMEASIITSKKFLSSRAFQQVPNELRRRTASHNVKKVPKKLRIRALREMKEDNTPTVTSRRRKPTPGSRLRLETAKKLHKPKARAKKREETKEQKAATADPAKAATPAPSIPRLKKNTLAKPEKSVSKFRKRQKHKAWLPTHLFHAKRAHMTEPKHPLWRFAIPLSPTEKSFRKTHRAEALRGCVAWDMSYVSTIGLEGAEASVLGLMRELGVDEHALSGNQMAKWRRGTRFWQGWLRERDNEKHWIAEVDVVWCIEEESSATTAESKSTGKTRKRRCLLRVHPSAFLQLWTEILKVGKMQRPPVMVEDLRFEIGSIELTGPASTEALVVALESSLQTTDTTREDYSSRIWSSLGSVTNPSILPLNAVLGFNVTDPRLHYPPRTINIPTSDTANDLLLQTLAEWLPDKSQTPPSIFDRTARLTASRLLPSQKAINRRKGDALPGEYPAPAATDPQIPILVMATRSPTPSTQGSWKLLLPWKCVLPVWYHIMYYPLSTGGNPRFGGLHELRQVAFERAIPWFPGDFPGVQAGWEWELEERAKRKIEWEKRPKGKRISWESLELGKGRKGEIGIGWACDWEHLFNLATSSQATTKDSSTSHGEVQKSTGTEDKKPEASTATILPRPGHHIPHTKSPSLLNNLDQDTNNHAVTTIHLHLLSRGLPTTCARIYRIPSLDLHLRSQWLALASSMIHPSKNHAGPNTENSTNRRKTLASLPRNESHPLRTQQTALSLLHPAERASDGPLQPGDSTYPCVPDAEDLIGFVTTGNYDLGQGKGSAIGSIAIAKVVAQSKVSVSGKTVTPGVGATGNGDSLTTDGENERLRSEIEELERKLGRKTVQKLCVVRNAGESVGRLAKWEVV
ncbi:MAG: hypothetical protein LQ352_005467 [Teloschistes flavicans]|nr:MAG: hypothetical protein LQ352_005467 [Teloschistes flavicans]